MEHREVAAATAAFLDDWLNQRTEDASPPRMVDLGCGDLALLAPLLRRLPLGNYTGLDLAPPVLPLAEQSLGPVPYPTQWLEGDLLTRAAEAAPITTDPAPQLQQHPAPGQSVDILHSAFAIHHLSDQQRASFLAAARQRLSPDGVFAWADQRRHGIDHLLSCDDPADRTAIEAVAEAAGWRWRWA